MRPMRNKRCLMPTLGQDLARIRREIAEEAEIKAYFQKKELERQRKRQAIADFDVPIVFAEQQEVHRFNDYFAWEEWNQTENDPRHP